LENSAGQEGDRASSQGKAAIHILQTILSDESQINNCVAMVEAPPLSL
jgi:hypothetical protein